MIKVLDIIRQELKVDDIVLVCDIFGFFKINNIKIENADDYGDYKVTILYNMLYSTIKNNSPDEWKYERIFYDPQSECVFPNLYKVVDKHIETKIMINKLKS